MPRVAAGLRHDVDDEPSGFGLAQSARGGEGDLFGGAGIDDIAGRRVAGRRTTDVRPSSDRRPSLPRPPWMGNCVAAVPVTTSFALVTTPGMSTTSAL